MPAFRQSPDHLTILDRIVGENLGARITSTTRIEGGFGGGSIHLVRVRPGRSDAEQDLIVKLGPVQGTSIVEDDDVDARIYAARSWSLAPVHALLRERGIPTYDLLGHGFPSDEIPFFWIIMSQLAGVEVRGSKGDPDPAGFHRFCGEALGALHALTRTDDGEVDSVEPHNLSWTEAFFRSLENAHQRVLARGDDTFCRHEREIP